MQTAGLQGPRSARTFGFAQGKLAEGGCSSIHRGRGIAFFLRARGKMLILLRLRRWIGSAPSKILD
jgi:hypothetical protein